MSKEKNNVVAKAVTNTADVAVELGKNLLEIYTEKIKNLELNIKQRKELAKELSVDEKKAANWKTVGDVFDFIDTSTLAKEHPQEAAKTIKLVLSFLSIILVNPIVGAFATIINSLSDENAALLVEWFGKPTPEHVVHKIAEKKTKKNTQ